jgi:alkanesulfonate monooxygenase SsuD/methylene tetrahydromethanopterin reductase-like flavin-dependent oxidoreductase (luciferase family)
LSEESIKAMARLGRPVLLRGRSVEHLAATIALYRDTMRGADFDAARIDKALDDSWVWCELHLAETDDEALEAFLPKFHQASRYLADMRQRWNPPEPPLPKPPLPLPRSAYGPTPSRTANEALVGSPARVTEQIALMREAGVRNLMLTNRGLMSPEETRTSLRLLSEKVMPQFK